MQKNAQHPDTSSGNGQTAVSLTPQLTAKNDDLAYTRPLLSNVLEEIIAEDCSEVHFEQDEGLCRIRKRLNGHLDERRIESATLAGDLIEELLGSNQPLPDNHAVADTGERTLKLKVGKTDYLLEYIFYPTACGQNLTIHIHCAEKLPETLDQTTLNTFQIQTLRNQVTAIRPGLTIICGPQALLQDVYYGFLGDANCVEKKIVSIERINRKKIPRINHIALTELDNPMAAAGIAIKHADLLFIDSQCSQDKTLIRQILDSNRSATLFINTANTTRAIAHLANFAINERQLASNLTTLIQLENTRLVCPHCADTHQLNGQDMQWLQNKPLGRNKNNVLVYTPGCDRCEFSGSIKTQTLLSVCAVEDNLRCAIESRSSANIESATQTILGTNSIPQQIDALVSQGKVSFTEYRAL